MLFVIATRFFDRAHLEKLIADITSLALNIININSIYNILITTTIEEVTISTSSLTGSYICRSKLIITKMKSWIRYVE